MTLRSISLAALLLAVPFAASAQDVGSSIAPESAPPVADTALGAELRASAEVFQDRSPTPQRGSVVVVQYFMNDVRQVTAALNGDPTLIPTLTSPEGEVFEAVPRAENGPVPATGSVGDDITGKLAVFQLPLFATEDTADWRFQIGTFGTGVKIILQ